jgi:hypothetical protein
MRVSRMRLERSCRGTHMAHRARSLPFARSCACGSGTRSGKSTQAGSVIQSDAISKTEGRRFETCRPCPAG